MPYWAVGMLSVSMSEPARVAQARVASPETDEVEELESGQPNDVTTNVRMKRPPERPVKSALDVMELRALVQQGKHEVEADMLYAGQLGGKGKMSTIMWFVIGLVFGCVGVAAVFNNFVLGELPTGYTSSYDVFAEAALCTLNIAAALCCFMRVYHLVTNRILRAYQSLVAFFIVLWLWMFLYTGDLTRKRPHYYQVNVESAAYKHGCTPLRACSATFFLPLTAVFGYCVYLVFRKKRHRATVALRGIIPFGSVSLALYNWLPLSCHEPLFFGEPAVGARRVLLVLFQVLVLSLPTLLSITIHRNLKLARSHAELLITDDRRRYDTIWDATRKSSTGALQKLQIEVKEVQRAQQDRIHRIEQAKKVVVGSGRNSRLILPTKDVDNESAFATEAFSHLLRAARAAGTSAKPRQRVSDLAVLYAQADRLNAHFQEVVETWARSSGGDFHFCSVKRRDRAIQKLYRSYENAADRLIDLVRSSITFDTVDNLTACLSDIGRNPQVVILQVKNRLSLDEQNASSGYRNVALSLLLVDMHTMEHGVDTHVAELQLGLRAFDGIKTDGGHLRYVSWRNQRAE